MRVIILRRELALLVVAHPLLRRIVRLVMRTTVVLAIATANRVISRRYS